MSQKPFQKFFNKTLLRSNKLFPAIRRNNDKNVHVLLACPLGSQWPWEWGQGNALPLLKGICFGPDESWLSLFGNDRHKTSISICNYFVLNSRLGFLMEMNKYFLQMKGKPPSLSRFGGHTSAVWYDHSHKAAWHPVPLQGFLSGQYFKTKPQPCPSPQSHILTTQSLLGHRHRAQTPQFGNSPDLRNTGLQACVFYRSSSLPWHKAPPSLAKKQEEKHSCSGSWGLNGALFQKTQKAMKMSIYQWEGGELPSCSLCGFAKSSLHGRIDEHSVLSTELGCQWQCAQNAWMPKPSHPLFRRHPPMSGSMNYRENTMWVYARVSSIGQVKSTAKASGQAWGQNPGVEHRAQLPCSFCDRDGFVTDSSDGVFQWAFWMQRFPKTLLGVANLKQTFDI